MPVYDYQALDSRGKTKKGIIDADNEGAARVKLRARGIYPTKINESGKKASRSGLESLRFLKAVKTGEINVMIRQLATLLGAGVPLVQGLESLVLQTGNTRLKKIIVQIKDEVNQGSSLTDAMARHPGIFSSVFINMIQAGEASGSLDIVLEKLADFGEKQEALRAKIRAALVYPIFMAVLGSAILFVLITYIVPNITQVFEEMDRLLPLPTLFLLGLSDFLLGYWWLLLLFAALTPAILGYLGNTDRGRRILDYLQLRIFLVGPVSRKIILTRFSSTLASLLESGVGLMDAMKILRNLVDNIHVAEVIDEAMERIKKGQSITLALGDSPWFPPIFVQMVGVGEQSGSLEKMLQKASEIYEREVETAIVSMTSLIEPIMIATMGLAVGFVVLSILLPIFEMNQMIG